MTAATLTLRDYQAAIVADLREALRKHRRVLLQLPTGGGKTAIASFIATETAAKGKRVALNCHRVELVEQTSLTWRKYGLAHGFVAAGRPVSGSLANVCSIDTLRRRLLTTPEPDIAIWDECHHLGAAGWQLIADHWRNARHIGLSATPWRLDGVGLGRQFDCMVQGPSVADLMQGGHLSDYILLAPNPPDMTGVKRGARGDYASADAAARMDVPTRVGDIITHWRRYANGLRTVVFAVNVADSKTIVERFNAAGIRAAHLDADTPRDDRARVIREVASGEVLVVSNVGLLGEGFDLSAIAQTDVTLDCLIDAAPSQSLSAVLQRWGRVLRPKSRPAVILDHAGNSNRHGFPDDEREWSLADRERRGKGAKQDPDAPQPPYTCTCFRQLRRPTPSHCPHCGTAIVVESRPVEEGDGELRVITATERAALRAARNSEESNAVTLQDLVALAHRRGYQNPTGWAFKRLTSSRWRNRVAHDRAGSSGT